MKKAMAALACVASLALFAFTKQPQTATFSKLSAVLYKTRTAGALKTEDQEKLKGIITAQYGVKAFNSETVLSFKKVTDPKDASKIIGYSIAEKTVGSAVFSQTIVNKGVAGELDEVTQRNTSVPTFNKDVADNVSAIIAKYNN